MSKVWNILKSTILYQDDFFVHQQEDVELPDGTKLANYNLLAGNDVVIVVPVLEDGRLVLVREYKHGVRGEVLQFPGGLIEEGETIQQAALRELREEAGYFTNALLQQLGLVVPHPTIDRFQHHVLWATDLMQSDKSQQDAQEETILELYDLEELHTALRQEAVMSGPALSALWLYEHRI